MYTLGDKYGIEQLQTIAVEKIRVEMKGEAPGVRGTLSYVSVADIVKREALNNTFSDVLATITHVYQNTQEEDRIRRMMVRFPWESSVLGECKIEWTLFLSRDLEYAHDMTLYTIDKIESHEDFAEEVDEYTCPRCEEDCIINWTIEPESTFTCLHCKETSKGELWGHEGGRRKPYSRSVDHSIAVYH